MSGKGAATDASDGSGVVQRAKQVGCHERGLQRYWRCAQSRSVRAAVPSAILPAGLLLLLLLLVRSGRSFSLVECTYCGSSPPCRRFDRLLHSQALAALPDSPPSLTVACPFALLASFTMSASRPVDLTRERDRDKDRKHHSRSSSSSQHRSHSAKPHHSSHSSSHRSSTHKPTTPTPPPSSLVKKTSQFQFEPVFTNTLPLPPAAPKRLNLPISAESLSTYCGGGLLATYKHPLYTDNLLSLPINFINPSSYITNPNNPPQPLSPTSKAVFLAPSAATAQRSTFLLPSRAQLFKQGYSNWARKPEYTSGATFQASNTQVALVDVRKKEVEEVIRRKEERKEQSSRAKEIETIERTFEAALHIPTHPRKRTVHAVSILPVLPAEGREQESVYGWIEFDYDPLTGDNSHLPDTQYDNTLLVEVGKGQHALYRSKGAGESEAGAVWEHVRDYDGKPTPAVDEDNNLYFVLDGDRVEWRRYTRRMRLSKRMRRGRNEEEEVMSGRPTEVRVEWREGVVEEEEQRSREKRRKSRKEENQTAQAEDEGGQKGGGEEEEEQEADGGEEVARRRMRRWWAQKMTKRPSNKNRLLVCATTTHRESMLLVSVNAMHAEGAPALQDAMSR